MNKYLKVIMMLLPIVLLIVAMPVSASEGEAYLRNQDNTNGRCRAYSVLMSDLQYSVLMTCRDITYPGDANQFNYVVWAEPTNGGNPERLGTLGVGKVELETRNPFNRLFVTLESSSRPRTPSTEVVMSGNLEQYDFGQPKPTQNPTSSAQPSSSPQATASSNSSLFSRLFAIQNIIAFLGVVLLLVLVFILTRR